MYFCTAVFNTGDARTYYYDNMKDAFDVFDALIECKSIIFAAYGEVGDEIKNSWIAKELRP